MVQDPRTRSRPYWHVDLKWIFGLIAVHFLVPALFVLSLYRLSSLEAVERMALGVTEAVPARQGVLGWYLGEVEKKAAERPQEELELPILRARLGLKGEAVLGLEREELRQLAASQLIRSLYQRGFLETFALEAPESQGKDPFLRAADLFGLTMHRTLGALALVLFLTAGAFALLMMVFSAGFGKAMSLGCALTMSSLPGFLFFTLIEVGVRAATSGQKLGGGQAILRAFLTNLAVVARIYQVGFIAGMGLFALGTVGSVALALWRKGHGRAAGA